MSRPSRPLLRCRAVARRWASPLGDRPPVDALVRVDLDLHVGECVAVEGEAGAGKSTLLLVAAGDAAPTRGRVSWDGTGEPAVARPYRMPARPWEYPSLTVRDALRYHVERAASTDPTLRPPARYVPTLRRVGLRGAARERLGALDALDAFRVVVAQALLVRPRLLCADEPVGALPPSAVGEALRLLGGVAREGVAVLLTSRRALPLDPAAGVTRRLALVAGRLGPAAGDRALEVEPEPRTSAEALRRLADRLPSMRRRGHRWRVPLEGRSPEQVLALCREVGVGVQGSLVTERPD